MKKYKFKINGAVYNVDILDVKGDLATIEVNGKSYEVEIEREVKAPAPKPKAVIIEKVSEPDADTIPGDGTVEEIKAPLPGVIIKVLVKTGDVVEANQDVCTLETMKMENAIKAEKAGVIKSVSITPGQSVQQDEVLIEMVVKE